MKELVTFVEKLFIAFLLPIAVMGVIAIIWLVISEVSNLIEPPHQTPTEQAISERSKSYEEEFTFIDPFVEAVPSTDVAEGYNDNNDDFEEELTDDASHN